MLALFFLLLAIGCLVTIYLDVKRASGGVFTVSSVDEWLTSLDLRRLFVARSLLISALLFVIASVFITASP